MADSKRHDIRERPGDRRVNAAFRKLRKNPTLSVTELAERQHLSTSRFQHLVLQGTGTNIRSWKSERQLQRAYRLLQRTTLSIKEIGSRCSIPDPANFSHRFKQRFGMTPAQCRRAQQIQPTE